jgi:hypothetical protein
MLLTACAASNEIVAPQLPEVPAGLRVCTDAALPPIPGAPGSALTKAQAAQALAEQRAAATAKNRCAAAWDDFYADFRKSLAKK